MLSYLSRATWLIGSRLEVLTQASLSPLSFNPVHAERPSCDWCHILDNLQCCVKTWMTLVPLGLVPTKSYTWGWSPLPVLQGHEISGSLKPLLLVTLGRDLSTYILGSPDSGHYHHRHHHPSFQTAFVLHELHNHPGREMGHPGIFYPHFITKKMEA